MKMIVVVEKKGSMARKSSLPPPPQRRPWPTSHRAAAERSVTRDEIARFWRRKRMEEEDHLLAALKAAARIRARTLKEDDYKQFEASLEGGNKDETGRDGGKNNRKEELRAVIGDWWTRSKYAYLNQPAIRSMEAAPWSFVPNSGFHAAVSTTPPLLSTASLLG